MNQLSVIEPLMPPLAPLDMPEQDLRRHTPVPVSPTSRLTTFYRLAVFIPALTTTGLLLAAFVNWLSGDGLSAVEMLLIGLVGFTFIWISLYVSSATLGFLTHFRLLRRNPLPQKPSEPMNVAVLIPIYSEDPAVVFGNAAAMADDLAQQGTRHRFTFYILSDTQDLAVADQELRAFDLLRRSLPARISAYYRRRPDNIDKKSGNIADWLRRWGAAHEAMLILDADSLMSGPAICALADALASDPCAGLIQSQPCLYAGETLFARMQQFAGATYGFVLSKGLALWTGKEGNFWGHNAIIRVRAFAETAGLPKIRGLRSRQTLILSHDIVEAALLRRGGWSVRFVPEIKGSYEEAPATLVDYSLRDRRWCAGNMQHLRVMTSAGLNWVSRFHMLHGAMGYLLSPVWFLLLVIWTLLGRGEDANPISYFSAQNPLYPLWPEQSMVNSLGLLCFMYAMLLTPKLMGIVTTAMSPGAVRRYGGARQFTLSFLTELFTSIAYAPVLMVQQTVAVFRSLIGIRAIWAPQQRKGGRYSLVILAKFHALETATGILLLSGMLIGIVSLWLLPIMASLVLAVPLSALSGLRLQGVSAAAQTMSTPDEHAMPAIVYKSRVQKLHYANILKDVASRPTLPTRRKPKASAALAGPLPLANQAER